MQNTIAPTHRFTITLPHDEYEVVRSRAFEHRGSLSSEISWIIRQVLEGIPQIEDGDVPVTFAPKLTDDPPALVPGAGVDETPAVEPKPARKPRAPRKAAKTETEPASEPEGSGTSSAQVDAVIDQTAKALKAPEASVPAAPVHKVPGCEHPKAQEKRFPYAVICGVCGEKIR
jgi:hypothetical protein